jgi:hypothetical protein
MKPGAFGGVAGLLFCANFFAPIFLPFDDPKAAGQSLPFRTQCITGPGPMKLRIRTNTVRVRLDQRDVEALSAERIVSDEFRYGPDPEHMLRYGIALRSVEHICIHPESDGFLIAVPEHRGREWIEKDSISLRARGPLPGFESIDILIEKDLACLTPRDEEDRHAFPNPAQTS